MQTTFKMLIDGQLVDGEAGTLGVVNPATEEVFAECPVASEAQMNAAVAAAKRAQVTWAKTPLAQRRAAIAAYADKIEANADEIARVLTTEQGKPLGDSHGEIWLLVATLRHFNKIDLPVDVIEDSAARRIEVHYMPLGVVVGIQPWNFPLGLIGNKLPAALLTGNTIVLKPAPTTPLSTLMLAELAAEVFPAGVINVIADRNDLGGPLSMHPDVAKVSFTGSIATGKKVAAAAASSLKRITLELGGNDPAIVLGDVDPKAIAPGLFISSMANSGQVCVALKRAYVHDDVYDAVVDELAELARNAVVDEGIAQGVQFGPIQNRAQYEKVKEYLDIAKRDGKIAAGGEVPDRPGFFVRPTIVRDIENDSALVQEEQFGPILPLVRFTDADEAIRMANDTRFGLAASVWSADEARAEEIALQLQAGTVWINQHLDLGPDIPLPAAKESGLGVELTVEGLKDFCQMTVLNRRKIAA